MHRKNVWIPGPRRLVLLGLLVITALMLAGCRNSDRATLEPTSSVPGPPAGATLTPGAVPDPCDYPADSSLCPVGTPSGAYPAPDSGLNDQNITQANAFHDCARTPSLTSCDTTAPPLRGRLAFYDASAFRLIFVDLESGEAWQVRTPSAPRRMEWSEDGQTLLVDRGADSYALYSANGSLIENFQSETTPRWQSGGGLTRDGMLQSADGWKAELQTDEGMGWRLIVVDPQGQQEEYPLTGAPDMIYSLRGRVPDRPSLLLQMYTAGNAAMLIGGELALFDAQSGELTMLDAFAPLDDSSVAWNPLPDEPPHMALLTDGNPEGGRGLAIYDFDSDEMRTPQSRLLPGGIIVNDLAWRPDGKYLIFSVTEITAAASSDARATFPSPGIYLLDPQTGEVSGLVQSPPGAVDGWPHWSGSGRAFIYARTLPGTGAAGAVQVRALLGDTGQDLVLVEGLPVENTVAGQVVWPQLIAFAKKQP